MDQSASNTQEVRRDNSQPALAVGSLRTANEGQPNRKRGDPSSLLPPLCVSLCVKVLFGQCPWPMDYVSEAHRGLLQGVQGFKEGNVAAVRRRYW